MQLMVAEGLAFVSLSASLIGSWVCAIGAFRAYRKIRRLQRGWPPREVLGVCERVEDTL